MKGFMTEKQASSEIAQSRERFEKVFAENRELDVTPNTTVYAAEFPYADIVTQDHFDCWQAAERDTRERVAQELKEVAGEIGSHVAYHIEEMYPGAVKATPKSFLLSVRNFTSNKISALAERIRGKE